MNADDQRRSRRCGRRGYAQVEPEQRSHVMGVDNRGLERLDDLLQTSIHGQKGTWVTGLDRLDQIEAVHPHTLHLVRPLGLWCENLDRVAAAAQQTAGLEQQHLDATYPIGEIGAGEKEDAHGNAQRQPASNERRPAPALATLRNYCSLNRAIPAIPAGSTWTSPGAGDRLMRTLALSRRKTGFSAQAC